MADTTNPTTNSGTIQAAQSAFAALLGEAEPQNPTAAGAPPADEQSAEPDAELTEESFEGDEEGEAEGESEGDTESTEDEGATPIYTVKVDGQEVEVTLDELRNGYSRTQDYTRKTQALAQQRKEAEAELEAVRGERAQYSQLLTALQSQLQQLAPQEPDWNKLYAEDPIEFVRQREVWRDRAEQLKAVQAEQARLQQTAQQEQLAQRQAALAEEAKKLVETIPEWKDAKRAGQEKAALVEYGVKLGYSADDVKGIADHRIVNVLRKAMMYDALMSKKGGMKPAPDKIKPAKPGSATSTPRKQSDEAQARQRLARTGNVRDAAAAFQYMIE
jgi:hypothetical protein